MSAGAKFMRLHKLFNGQLWNSTILRRSISSVKNNSRKFTEVEIPVPWGKIAGKHWGPVDVEPILALHGWQDNAASFDPLIKDLPEDLSILAVDFPGHGFSSWLPKGMVYSDLMYVQIIERIKQHYKMEKVGLLGHSMGGILSFSYAAIFPESAKFVVTLDYFKYPTISYEKILPIFIKDWATFFNLEQSKSGAPKHSEEEALSRYVKASWGSLNEEMCKTLMTRGATKHADGKVSFNRDPRVQLFLLDSSFSHEEVVAMAARIRSPYLLIKGESSRNVAKEKNLDILEIIKDNALDFGVHTIPGTHHFHMFSTKALAELIVPFMKKYL